MVVNVFPTKLELANAAADALVKDLIQAIETMGSASWVLAGGTSPDAAYKIIASKYLNDVHWSDVSFIMGDERQVPLDHVDSNWGQAEKSCLHMIDGGNKLIPETHLPLESTASQYELALKTLPLATNGRPRLDHVWLGMGEDGHTLSLFPGRPSLNEAERLVLPIFDSPKPPPQRITLTLEALKGTRHLVIMAAGQGKAAMLKRVFDDDLTLPIGIAAKTVADAGGAVTWLLDKDASSSL